MNIYTLPGKKVKCTSITSGWAHDQEIAKQHLLLNQEYTVHHTVVGRWETDVFLMEFPRVRFNSVFFSDIEPQTLAENQAHPDYAKYNS